MENYEGKVNLVKVDVDEVQDLAMDYGVGLYSKFFFMLDTGILGLNFAKI